MAYNIAFYITVYMPCDTVNRLPW